MDTYCVRLLFFNSQGAMGNSRKCLCRGTFLTGVKSAAEYCN